MRDSPPSYIHTKEEPRGGGGPVGRERSSQAKETERALRLLLDDRVWSDPEPGTRRGEWATRFRFAELSDFRLPKGVDGCMPTHLWVST